MTEIYAMTKFTRILIAVALSAFVAADLSLGATISTANLLGQNRPGGIIDNAAFWPTAKAAPPREPFSGMLSLSEVRMLTNPEKLALVLDRDPQLFPAVALTFFTEGNDLVPFTQDVIRYATAGRGKSYWDVLVQPGRVWSEPADGGWSRAAFPFALVNSIEGETHNGIATFLYRGKRVSNLRFQIVMQTASFYVKESFLATGLVPAAFRSVDGAPLQDRRQAYRLERDDRLPLIPWQSLAAQVGADKLEAFDGELKPNLILMSGLDYQGTFYLKSCRGAGGNVPWCDRARFGVWSATKALAIESALLRLAQKFGPSVFDLKISDYVPEAAAFEGWRHVRFEDAVDMATGIGNGTTRTQPNDIVDGYLDASYATWYEARSVHDKVMALLKDGRSYPWGPGKVARYRDQDMFILGVALDRFLKSKEGPSADIWGMLRTEVFEPIGVHEAPTNRTIEPDGSIGQPLMAYGYYPTVGEVVRVARLYQNRGRWGGTQILDGVRIDELLTGKRKGLPSGEHFAYGEVLYSNALWFAPYSKTGACHLYYPSMVGWGGNLVALLPDGLTGVRLANGEDNQDPGLSDTDGMARVADRIAPLCH